MKPQHSKKNEGTGRLARTDQRVLSWPLPSGLLMADSGLLTIAFAGWEALASPQTLLYSCGATLCLAGLVLIWIGTPNLGSSSRPPSGRRHRTGNTQILGIGESRYPGAMETDSDPIWVNSSGDEIFRTV